MEGNGMEGEGLKGERLEVEGGGGSQTTYKLGRRNKLVKIYLRT